MVCSDQTIQIKQYFQPEAFIYIFAVGLMSLVLCCSTFFEAQYVSSSPTGPCNRWWSGKNIARWLESFFKMIPPSFIMLVLFIHMVHKTSLSTVASAESKAKMRGKMTRMVGIASLLLIICFAPSQTLYALAMAGITQLDSKLHTVLFWLLSTAP